MMCKGHQSLFDLAKDPGERSPLPGRPGRPIAKRLLDDHQSESAEIREAVERRAESAGASGTPVTPVTPETEESLRALGYIE